MPGFVQFSFLERWNSHRDCWQASETFTCGSFMLGASDGKTRTRWIAHGIQLEQQLELDLDKTVGVG